MKNNHLIESYIYRSKNESNFTGEDLVGIFSPLLSQLEKLHAQDKIGLFYGLESFTENINHRLRIDEEKSDKSINNPAKINLILPRESKSFDIISEQDMLSDLSKNEKLITDYSVSEDISNKIIAPVFVPAYKSFETILGHHDPLTDIHVLGLVMASLAFSLDLREASDIKKLNAIVKNPGIVSNATHPNITKLILDMVQLDRRKRIRDAYEARIRLENYLEYSYNSQEDINLSIAQYKPKKGDKNKWILSKLRNRLFDLSRRNKLIYFKKSSRYVNLTLASVPNVLDYNNIRPEKLVLWNKDIAEILQSASKIKLNKYLQLKQNPQIGISLKKVYYEGNRDKAEYGFNQLKLAIAFLNWYNYKENPNEKIQSPLLLIPIELKKRKGINDDFIINPIGTEVQVNPVLSHYLKELFDIYLPKSYDLSQVDIHQIYKDINQQIISKSNEVTMDFVDKPKLRVIHSQAKRSFEAYQKKIRKSLSRNIWKANGEYSYSANDYSPLGVKLFNNRVKKYASLVEFLIDSDVKMDQNAVDSSSVNRDFFQIENNGNINPYLWEFDLCNFTLGNFNYQKMTLAHDYDQIVSKDIHNQIFSKLFSEEPRTHFKNKKNNYLIANNYCVIPADATQLGAIQSTENNGSYIIQGPPGTGKSQTIVNLLANEVAKGKSVLFISEKRAALDVVYARMSQIGLKDICTLIHDSQSDKKAFIQDLKYTYELYAKETNQWDDVADKRKEIIKRLQENIDILYKFHSFQKHTKETYSVRQIIDILINTKFDKNAYKDLIYTEAPAISEWLKYRESLNRIEQYLQTNTRFKLISDCPYFYLDAQILNNVNAQTIIAKSDRFEKELSFINGLLETKLAVKLNNFEQINEIISILSKLYILHKDNKTALLDPSSAQTAQFEKSIEEIEQWKSKISQAEEKNKYWIKKPSKDELKRLNKQYKEATGGFLKKLLGKKEEFINTLKKFYDFDSQLVPPEVEEVLSGLNDEYELKLHLQNLKNQFENDSKITKEELNNYRTELDKLINISGHSQLLNNNDLITLLDEMPKISKSYENLTEDKDLLAKHIDVISDLYDHIDELRINTSILYGLAPRLKEWQDLPDVFRQYILNHKLIVNEIEYLSAYKQLLDVSRENGSDINGKELERVVEQIQLLYPKLLKINSTYINEIVKKKFQTALDLDFMPVYEMTNEQKNTKQHYQEGRAILENEFNKKIRYKSIRDLVDEKSGTVIKDLKPVWMMSPLSVSDTLPLTEIFDIVIFDEASQITVEEGIPPLFRASQAIIVGDEMQMPPSNFFSTKLEEDDDEAEFLSMDAESLLNQGVRKLPQVTLGWHYRSRQEALINFSNFAFYEGALYTIPDVYSVDNQQNEIEVYKAKDAIKNTPLIYKNSITYHYLPTGIYDNRMNDDEAEYIAYMVREILMSDTNKSLGIVAFSMQQQSNIENALNRLANDDTKFAIVLEEAFSGNNEEEFTGLFVKNLENVQGDERDIMILSICYGYNPKGKMLMNFGPINRRGGEKRLNVIFSRAKYHMVIVSSIKHNDITNEYNEGANYLKKYLQYSQYVSAGKFDAAQSILHNLGRRKQIKDKAKETLWIDEIKQFLEEKGYFVKLNLGQSRLKIDLGIKKEKTQKLYDLGIIIDHIESYQSNDVLSQYYTIPQILNVFGWQVYKIFANDWLNHKDSILQNIIDVLENKIIKPEANDIIAIEANEEKIEEEISEISDGKIVELINLSKNKFWTIKQNNNKINIVIGSIGETGFSSDYNFDNISAADEYFENQIISRKSRGFKEKE